MTDSLTTTPATYLRAAEDGHLGRMIEGYEKWGFEAFFKGESPPSVFVENKSVRNEWYRGQHRAWAVCYAQGAVEWNVETWAASTAAGDPSPPATNPYPQFSPAWEAWAEGHDDHAAGALG